MTKKPKALPPVPSQVFSHLGPVPVTVEPLEGVHGITRFTSRTIGIHEGQNPAQAWQTLWHEAMHVVFFDAGVKLPLKVEENLCDAIGTYLTAAMLAGFLKVQDPNDSP